MFDNKSLVNITKRAGVLVGILCWLIVLYLTGFIYKITPPMTFCHRLRPQSALTAVRLQ